MQMAALISIPDLAVLLEQALALPVADECVFELASRAKVLAEAADDREALTQSMCLLGQHHLNKREFERVLPLLEPLLEAPFVLAADLRAEVLLAVIRASDAMGEVNKTCKYGNEALHFFVNSNCRKNKVGFMPVWAALSPFRARFMRPSSITKRTRLWRSSNSRT